MSVFFKTVYHLTNFVTTIMIYFEKKKHVYLVYGLKEYFKTIPASGLVTTVEVISLCWPIWNPIFFCGSWLLFSENRWKNIFKNLGSTDTVSKCLCYTTGANFAVQVAIYVYVGVCGATTWCQHSMCAYGARIFSHFMWMEKTSGLTKTWASLRSPPVSFSFSLCYSSSLSLTLNPAGMSFKKCVLWRVKFI
jgi:hypothetical protein